MVAESQPEPPRYEEPISEHSHDAAAAVGNISGVRTPTTVVAARSSGTHERHGNAEGAEMDSDDLYPSYAGNAGEKGKSQKGAGGGGDRNSNSVEELGTDAFVSEEAYERAQRGRDRMKSLGWIKTGVLLCVDAIALGALSLPGAYATLGMVPGVLLTVFLGILATYAGSLTGSFFLRHPTIRSYGDAGWHLFAPLGPRWARWGYETFSWWLCVLLVFNMASHTLTGTLMWQTITGAAASSVCSLAWVGISAAILFLFALPPTFADFAWLGYIDFASIVVVIVATFVLTGVDTQNNKPGGLAGVDWSVLPPPGTTFAQAMNAVGSIVFAYSFNTVLFSLQVEMHHPQDIHKSVALVGAAQVFIYVVTGAVILRFVGNEVKSPAILSDPGVSQRVVFGLAIPVIFISGSINGNVVAKLVHGRFMGGTRHRYINTFKGWGVWILILLVEAALSFVSSRHEVVRDDV